MLRPLLASIAAIGLLACQGDHDQRRLELEQISARRASDVAQFDAARVAFVRQYPVPQRLNFQGEGTLLLEECELLGRLGREELWVKYTYENTTGHAIDGARVTLTLHDPESGGHWSEDQDLAFPSLRLGPESTYTTHFQVPTRGIHLHPGWSWEIRAQLIER